MSSNLKPLILHAHTTGPNPIKIAIALEKLSLPYTIKLWEFGDNPENGLKGTKFLAINENGRVPALEDPNSGVVSWESGAVMNYIRRKYDKENQLGPKGKTEQDIVDFEKWEYFLLTTVGPMTGQTNWYRHYNEVKNEDALNRYAAQTYRCYQVLEGQLKKTNGESILPGGYTAVDAHFEPWIRQHAYAQLSLDEYPMVSKWLKKYGETEEVKAAYKKIQDAAS
ncbi:glutathione S-transferase, partial [Aureobasidium melanogenum]|uniref:Glutathione S-transferase n=1 Tax=Aureobasidium melanogenum (strain CBS 110374) TaxID=1043003 RepID=A0A074W3Z4_AURM1